MEKLQMLAMVQAYTGIGVGLMIGLGAAGSLKQGLRSRNGAGTIL